MINKLLAAIGEVLVKIFDTIYNGIYELFMVLIILRWLIITVVSIAVFAVALDGPNQYNILKVLFSFIGIALLAEFIRAVYKRYCQLKYDELIREGNILIDKKYGRGATYLLEGIYSDSSGEYKYPNGKCKLVLINSKEETQPISIYLAQKDVVKQFKLVQK